MRVLEGKAFGSAGPLKAKTGPPKYDPARQGAAGAAVLTTPQVYNTDADVVAEAVADPTLKKKKRKQVGG